MANEMAGNVGTRRKSVDRGFEQRKGDGMLKEIRLKLYEPKHKPEIDEIVIFQSKTTGWCLGSYTGSGEWLDLSGVGTLRIQKTSEIVFWCKAEDLDS